MFKENNNITIIGAGLTGLAFCNLLKNTDVKIMQSVKIFRADKERLERLLCEEKDKMRNYWLNRENDIRTRYEDLLAESRAKYESTFVHTQNSTILGQDGEIILFASLISLFLARKLKIVENNLGGVILF